ncbi:thiamine pyrophosphate enzyme [Colletotrichum karsti]|uniref:Pyruvate decarboxylase n=1 Tax=Colletotrichum karsti TaxID=1095194 RepID=A0A9P6HVZ7_9PEZI|nr:thiamine pyrophosphate enzyme [Colletotrichum karsti]KAF9870997.1 thiamine pyrophosphate enzyme [Colletotrichum karsti]
MPRQASVPLARYLFTRLAQQNVRSLFGVPGDFTLKAQDHVESSGLKWIGNCNELNAGYAADGYARTRGLGALMTTYGVGELSAVNAVTGSYSEHVPVVHIVGTPATRLQVQIKDMALRDHRHVHHTLADPTRLGVFGEIAAKVTAAQVKLDSADSAAEKVDWVIDEAIRHSRPVYVELPSDLVDADVDGSRLGDPIGSVVPNSSEIRIAEGEARKLMHRLCSAKQPLLLIDRGMGVQGLREEINSFVRASGIPTLCMPSGAGMVENDLPNYYGVHSGPVGKVDTMSYVESADFVLAFGPMFSDTQTLGWNVLPDRAKTTIFGRTAVDNVAVDGSQILCNMSKALNENEILIPGAANEKVELLSNWRNATKLEATPADERINQTGLYDRLNQYLRPHDTVILGNATPIIGGRDMVLPRGARVVASGMWFSIGHMLPAALGVGLARREHGQKGRTILIDGDGNIQMTIQEISSIIRERLDITIFIVQNQGYAYERLIHGLHESYNDLAPWRYLEAARFFGAPDDYPVSCHRVETWADLDGVLGDAGFCEPNGLKLIELVLDKYDVPDKFRQVFRRAGENL